MTPCACIGFLNSGHDPMTQHASISAPLFFLFIYLFLILLHHRQKGGKKTTEKTGQNAMCDWSNGFYFPAG